MKTVNPNVGVRHHTIEFDKYQSVVKIVREREVLPIPADSRRHEATALTCGVLFIDRPVNAPIMWHRELAPTRVVELVSVGAGHISFLKAPIAIERRTDARGVGTLGKYWDSSQAKNNRADDQQRQPA